MLRFRSGPNRLIISQENTFMKKWKSEIISLKITPKKFKSKSKNYNSFTYWVADLLNNKYIIGYLVEIK